jgi:hypothetical protein
MGVVGLLLRDEQTWLRLRVMESRSPASRREHRFSNRLHWRPALKHLTYRAAGLRSSFSGHANR